MSFRSLLVGCSVVLAAAAGLNAQSAAPAPSEQQIDGGTPAYIKAETPEKRRERLGMVEDPGLNPDPNKIWSRFGHQYHIQKYERRFAAYDQVEGFVRPMTNVNFGFEIYQQNEKYVWIWMPTMDEFIAAAPPNNDAPPEKVTRYTQPQLTYLRKRAPEFRELEPPAASKVLRFEDASDGLPTNGSFRNSAAIADMNGDGNLDIVVPPSRGPAAAPNIFLGDGKGHWTTWRTVWPYPIQYGNVVVADFNRDKKMDVAFGVHLTGVRVFLGDGEGNFREANDGLDAKFPTRRVIATDVNGDGATDLLALYEGPTPGISLDGARVKAFLNHDNAKRWEMVEGISADDYVGGDWMSLANFDGDKYPDFVASNSYYQRPEALYRGAGPAKWQMIDHRDGELVPYMSMYTAVGAGKISSTKRDDAIMSYQRFWPGDVDPSIIPTPPIVNMTGIDRITFTGKQPERTPVIRFSNQRPISGLAIADFDKDGKNDILFTKFEPRETVLLLGDGKGGFMRAPVEGVSLATNPNYDVNVADINRDGLPDLVVMYESNVDSAFASQNGMVKVFLNRGPAKNATSTASAK